MDGRVVDAPAGTFVYGPRELPHTFAVTSERARFLLVAQPAGFERFMRALSEPAHAFVLPPAARRRGARRVAAEHGIEILGPPGIPA